MHAKVKHIQNAPFHLGPVCHKIMLFYYPTLQAHQNRAILVKIYSNTTHLTEYIYFSSEELKSADKSSQHHVKGGKWPSQDFQSYEYELIIVSILTLTLTLYNV